jgi:mitotic spindle assembly checkpoint protein MAD2B
VSPQACFIIVNPAYPQVEITLHTILYLRAIYPPSTFARRRAHGVPVYQSRHPQVREYIAEVVGLLRRELDQGNLRRVSVVVKSAETGVALERFLIDVGYGDVGAGAGGSKDVG